MDTKLKIENKDQLVVLNHVHVHEHVHIHYNTCTLYVREIHVHISDINEYSTVWSIYINYIYIYIYIHVHVGDFSSVNSNHKILQILHTVMIAP